MIKDTDLLISRYFTTDDPMLKEMIFSIPRGDDWWSRFYEYEWAKSFAKDSDVALDAASGICHPFKFYLIDNCKEVYACDIDERILSSEEILKEISEIYGEESVINFRTEYLEKINYSHASLTNLPYEDNTFDKIYCISVIEHLNDIGNRYPIIPNLSFLNKFLQRDIYSALKEFRRVLKDSGLIILTFDWPSINLNYFLKTMPKLNLTLAGDLCLERPSNAIYSKKYDVYCFRVVLKKD